MKLIYSVSNVVAYFSLLFLVLFDLVMLTLLFNETMLIHILCIQFWFGSIIFTTISFIGLIVTLVYRVEEVPKRAIQFLVAKNFLILAIIIINYFVLPPISILFL